MRPIKNGDKEDRTPDPLLAKQVLSQLSYTPINGYFLSILKIEQCGVLELTLGILFFFTKNGSP